VAALHQVNWKIYRAEQKIKMLQYLTALFVLFCDDETAKGAVDTLYSVRFREVSGLRSFKNFYNQTTGCGDIAHCLVGYFIPSHPVDNGRRRPTGSA